MSPRTIGILFASITALSWASLPIFLMLADKTLSVGNVVFFRFIFSFLALFFFFAFRDPSRLKVGKPVPWLAFASGLFLTANYFGYNKCAVLTTPSFSQVLIQLAPVLTAFGGWLIFKEKISRIQVLGFVVAIVGMSLFFNEQLKVGMAQVSDVENLKTGAGWMVFGSVNWAIYGLMQRHISRSSASPQQINMIIYGTATILSLPWFVPSEFSRLDGMGWLLMIYLALNTIIAYGCLTEAFKRIPTNLVSIILVCNPVVTFIIMEIIKLGGWTFIRSENVSLNGYFGGAIMILGAVLVVSQPRVKV